MFDSIRRHNKVIQILLFVLVFPAFVLVGVSSFSSFTADEVMAEGKNVSVSTPEFEQQLKAALDQARGGDTQADTSALDTPGLRQAVLDSLLARKLYDAQAKSAYMTVTPQQLQQALRSNPIVAPYLDAQGRLIPAKKAEYESAVKLYGLDITSFEKNVALQIPLTQIDQVFGNSYFAPSTQAFLQRLLQSREVQVLPFSAGNYVESVKVDDQQASDWYKAHQASFTIPENVDVEYVILDALALGQSAAAPTDAQLQSFFDKNANRFGGNVTRQASHILIAVAANASAEDKAKAKQKAEALRAQLVQNPSSFAEVAKQSSEDPGSKAAGGSLGSITPGTMVKPFEEATFALKTAGEMSPVVETEFGYHIIKLDKIEGKQPTLAEVRPEVLKAYQEDIGQQRYTEQSENFRNAVHEAENGLTDVAKNFKLTLQTAKNIGRKAQANQGSGLDKAFTNPALLTALFSTDSLQNKQNTDVLQVGDRRLIAARVSQHHAARTPPFSEVADAAKAKLRLELAAKAALAAAKDKLTKLQANPQDTTGFGAPVTVSRMMSAQGLPRALLDAAMRPAATSLPSVVLADLKTDGAALVRVIRVQETNDTEKAQQSWALQVQQVHSLAERIAFIQAMKARAKVQVEQPEKLQPSRGTP